jgi:hypothetical protein
VQSSRRQRLGAVKQRGGCGTREAVARGLAACGWQINTAFRERLQRAIRQRVAAVGRRVNTRCRGEEGRRAQRVVGQTYHNFVLPHTR